MSIAALIPARGGSKGIPRKNIKQFCGKPLIQWTIEEAQKCKSVQRIIVSTEDDEIANVAKNCGAEVPFKRPLYLADDKSLSINTVLHVMEKLPEIEDILLMQPTSPLRTFNDIENIINIFRHNNKKSAVGVTEVLKHPNWMYQIDKKNKLIPLLNNKSNQNRQKLDKVYIINGSLYIANKKQLIKEKSFINANTIPYLMPFDRSIDIDDNYDWNIAFMFMNKILNQSSDNIIKI